MDENDLEPVAASSLAPTVVRRLDELQHIVAVQATVINELRARLDLLDAPASAPATPAEPDDADVATPLTSRRRLMTGGAAAAGAAVAAALTIASAPPAAATSNVFTGDPAVDATASPGNGTALRGATTTGRAVYGIATSGTGIAVVGQKIDGAGIALEGDNFSTTGVAEGVRGYTTSTAGRGVFGWASATSGATRGVEGQSDSPSGAGVYGVATNASGSPAGVFGTSQGSSGVGVGGGATSTSGVVVGVLGQALASPGGIGVAAEGQRVGVSAYSTTSQLQLGGGPAPPLTAGLDRQAGELMFDANQDLWLCTADGTPGTWRRLGGSSAAGSLVVLPSTVRIYDSRAGLAPLTVQKGIFGNHEERVINATLGGAVPAGATAVLINATATNTNPGGFFAFFKNTIAWPNNSSLNWGLPNSTIANLAVVAVDSAAQFKARCEGPGGADLVVDCIGYYQ